MSQKEENQRIEEIKISFVGLDADKGIIDVRDLTRALEGWIGYWEISSEVFLNKELSTKPLPQDIRPQIKVKALRHESFDILTCIIIPLSMMIGYDIFKVLWRWQYSLIKRHIKSKKELISKEEAIEAFKKLADKYQIKTHNDRDVLKVIDLIDESLNNFVEPINRSAKQIVVTSSSAREPIRLTSSDKQALRSGYHVDPSLSYKGFEKCNVSFIRINTETGNALIRFDKPDSLYQMGHVYSQIIDTNVKEPKNIYARAFYEGTSLEVWGRMSYDKSNQSLKWQITANLPEEPLFDRAVE